MLPVLEVISDNQSFFQWFAGIVVTLITAIVTLVIRGIKKDIDDNKEETAVLRAKVEVLETRIMDRLGIIQADIATLMVLAKHDRPSMPCQEWAKNLVADKRPPRRRSKPKPKVVNKEVSQ